MLTESEALDHNEHGITGTRYSWNFRDSYVAVYRPTIVTALQEDHSQFHHDTEVAESTSTPHESIQDSTQSDMDPDFEGEGDESTHTVPSVLIEPDVPDPFVVDDGSADSDSSSEHPDPEEDKETSDGSLSPVAEDNIALAQSVMLETPAEVGTDKPLPSPNIEKAVPPPPESISDEEDEEEPPELFLPGLIIPTMFLPIPNVSLFSSEYYFPS